MSMRAKCDRQKMWRVIRAFEKFSISEIAEFAEISVDSAHKYVWMLRRHGYVTWQEGDRDNTKFRLVRDTGSSAPIESAGSLKDPNMAGKIEDESQRMWIAIKAMKVWDCYSLAAHAGVKYPTAIRYSKCLAAAEYANYEQRDARIKNSRDQYQLTKMTGPDAPLFPEDGSLFDPNLFLKELWALKSKKKRKVKA